jgi:hypothetical protein
VIDTLLNLLFRCAHRRLTSPFTPVRKKGLTCGDTYVVCLDCGKQFEYDLNEMRIGKGIDHSHDACVVPRDMPMPPKNKLKLAVAAAVPVAAVVIATMSKSRKNALKKTGASDEPAVGDRVEAAPSEPAAPPQGK